MLEFKDGLDYKRDAIKRGKQFRKVLDQPLYSEIDINGYVTILSAEALVSFDQVLKNGTHFVPLFKEEYFHFFHYRSNG